MSRLLLCRRRLTAQLYVGTRAAHTSMRRRHFDYPPCQLGYGHSRWHSAWVLRILPLMSDCFSVVLSSEAGETSQARICSMPWAAVLKDALHSAATDHPLLEKLVVVCQRLTTFAYEVDRGCSLPRVYSPCSCPDRHSTSAYTGRRPGSLRKRGLRMFFGRSCKRVARRSAIF